jgi:NAD(P)-dependent dehydrogenase (short-subunit alcohol dehydrogenase family)
MDLTSRVVVLTGGRRMGASVATRLAEAGGYVIVTHRGPGDDASEVVARVRAAGGRAEVRPLDVADSASVATFMTAIEASHGRLDVLVNMASIYEAMPLHELTEDEWHRQLQVDLHGTFRMCLAAVPLMKRTGGGRIINFSDWIVASGRPRYAGYLAYYVAKAGVKALTEALALELAPERILVNAIAPGPILAPSGTSEQEQAEVARATPLGRWGGADEIAKMVTALIDSDFVTGETIRVDGGRHVR